MSIYRLYRLDALNIDALNSLLSSLTDDLTQLRGQVNDNASKATQDLGYARIVEVQPKGTAGGSFEAGDWRIRTLNTVQENSITGVSLKGNVITVPEGTYDVHVRCPAFHVSYHGIRFWDIQAKRAVLNSQTFFATTDIAQVADLIGRAAFSSTARLRVEHRCTTTKTVNGFGVQQALFDENTYSIVEIWRIK